MPTIPAVFRQSGGKLVNFNFEEAATNTGYITYYAFAALDSASTKYATGQNVVYSEPRGSKGTGTSSATPVLTNTYNFDNAAYKQHVQLRGDAIINLSFGAQGNPGIGAHVYLVLTLQKMSGATATTIGTIQTPTLISGATNTYNTSCLKMSCTTTDFGIDDYLRMKVEMYVQQDSGGASSAGGFLAHDPQNRDISTSIFSGGSGSGLVASTNPSQFAIHIPFKADS